MDRRTGQSRFRSGLQEVDRQIDRLEADRPSSVAKEKEGLRSGFLQNCAQTWKSWEFAISGDHCPWPCLLSFAPVVRMHHHIRPGTGGSPSNPRRECTLVLGGAEQALSGLTEGQPGRDDVIHQLSSCLRARRRMLAWVQLPNEIIAQAPPPSFPVPPSMARMTVLCTVLSYTHRMCARMCVDPLKARPNPGEASVAEPWTVRGGSEEGVVRLARALPLHLSTLNTIPRYGMAVCRVSAVPLPSPPAY